MTGELMEKLARVKVLALDCDGVMTPPYIETGVIMEKDVAAKYEGRTFNLVFESARFCHRDGQGIDLVRDLANIAVVVITKQRSGYVDARCFKLGIPCVRTKNKVEGLKKWLADNLPQISLEEVCFVGDDISDIEVMKQVGVGVCVADGAKEAKEAAYYVTNNSGGEGAVREVCDLLIKSKKTGGCGIEC